jgi:beta-glucosidase
VIKRRTLLKAMGATAAGGLLQPQPAAAQALRFPAGFLWGTATSAYQVEGRGANGGPGRADSIWDSFCRLPGKIKDGSNGDIACDHYHRYPEDIALMARASLKAYRFSITWPRVLPAGTGQPDPRGLDFYSRLTDALLKAGIEPWVCLYHWDLPQPLQDGGGWTSRAIADRYAEYAGLVARRLGDRVSRWITFNEPSIHAILGHALGEHAPGLKSQAAMLAALHHQNLAHGRGVAALRAIGGSRFQIGTVLSLQPAHPADGLPANQPAADLWDAVWNRACLDPLRRGSYPAGIARSFEPLLQPGDLAEIARPIDFIGVNYYNPMFLKPDPGGPIGGIWGAVPASLQRTALGWPIDPNGLVEVLVDLRDHYGNPPVYVTENGACFADQPGPGGRVDDQQRIDFLHDHLAACHRALAQKCNLRGYFVWTLLDNFEWAEGYAAPFGIVRIDRATLQRTPKASFDWFARVAQSNGV